MKSALSVADAAKASGPENRVDMKQAHATLESSAATVAGNGSVRLEHPGGVQQSQNPAILALSLGILLVDRT